MSEIRVDTISEKTSANGVAVDGVTIKDGGIAATAASTITTADNTAQLTLTSTDTDANSGPRLDFIRNPGEAGADADFLSAVLHRGYNDATELTTFVEMNAQIVDASNGSEDGRFYINTMVAGTAATSRMELTPTETVFNEGSVDLDFRIEGNGDANAFFLDGEVDRIYLGHNADTDINGLNARLQISGTDFDKSSASFIRYSNNANGPSIGFAKSRNASIAGNTIVNDGDELGKLRFAGADGGDFANVAAEISASCDGTPGVNDMPGRLSFKTAADGGTGTTERVRIHNNGVASFNNGVALGVGTANTASNVLDDYEEGDWTPGWSGSGGAPSGVNFDSREGRYVKIGRKVFIQAWIDTQSISSNGTDQVLVTGLPFTVRNSSSNAYSGIQVHYAFQWNATQTPTTGLIVPNTTYIALKTKDGSDARSNMTTNVNWSNYNGDERLSFSAHYET